MFDGRPFLGMEDTYIDYENKKSNPVPEEESNVTEINLDSDKKYIID
jgi:hypothetical protein